MIVKATTANYDEIIEVWEASVRATHHFLAEEHIQLFKPLIRNKYLTSVDLWCAVNGNSKIVGFLGVANANIEMLFIHPQAMAQGIGKSLVNFAVQVLHANKVDVNEQNTQAVGFYERMGFKVVGRSEKDGLELPYPILHLSLA
jgi:putative acetyltransferase